MFRISTSTVLTARRLLYRHIRPEIRVAGIVRTPLRSKYSNPHEREPCPARPPPPPPKPKDDSLIWGTLTLLALAGAFAVYAKSNPELRDWLTLNAPWVDDIIAVLHEENMTYGEFIDKCIKDVTDAINSYFTPPPPICDSKGNVIPVAIEEKCPPEKPITGDYVIVNISDLDSDVDDKEAECNKLPPPIVTKDICEIEQCLKDLGETAFHNYMTARDACIVYIKEVQDALVTFTPKKLKNLHDAKQERMELVKEHVENATCASAKLDELARYFKCGVQAPKDVVKNTNDLLKEYQDKIKAIHMQFQWENDKALILDVEFKMVEELLDKYMDECVKMTRELDYMSSKPQLRGDPDLLIYHTKRYVDQLKEELNEVLLGMSERVSRAMETLPGDIKAQKERDANILATTKKQQADMEADFKKRTDNQKTNNDIRAKEAMQKLIEQSKKTLEIRLQEKTIEANKKLEKMVATQVEIERKQMAKEKAVMALKLKIVEGKLEARLKAERETRRSQELWAAGYKLLAATKKGDPIVKVDNEIKAIQNATGDGDKLVLSVLKAIPESVKKKGVIPESVIRQKYHVMEDVALKVALVEQEGAPLPVFILSYIQSFFLFMKLSGIPQKEYDKPPKEAPTNLDTFDLLQRARFWIDRGDIASALKYVDALEGASRAAADNWYEAAREHLETRQAAEAVLAHAAALGLQYI